MHSEFLDIEGHRIYSVTEEPDGEYIADFAVLLCYPFGNEYMRSHRAFRQLGALLARRGVVSMRFDYAGTGDSSGGSDEFSLASARAQIASMATELGNLTAVDDVRVIGLRLGATLACEALSNVPIATRIALWDPVISGERYLREMRATISPGSETDYILDNTWWINGFPVGESLRQEMSGVDLPGLDRDSFKRVLLLAAEGSADAARLRESWESGQADFTHRTIDNRDAVEWIQDDIADIYSFSNRFYTALVDWVIE